MTTHRIATSQVVGRPPAEVFGFFAEPRNLARITPPQMGFEFLSRDFGMRPGLHIDYRLRPLAGVPVTWRTLIDVYEPPFRFIDIQEKGPYARWIHEHTFRAVDGGTVVEDSVDYALPLGRLGELAHFVVRQELEQIFRHRARAIEHLFATPEDNPNPLRVAVAGGTGFVGGAIAQTLFRRGHHVRVLSHRGEAARGALPDGVELLQLDVAADDAKALTAALGHVEALVIALAFKNSPVEAPRKGQTFELVDAKGTERLVAAARAAGVKQILYLSGAGAAPESDKHWFRAKWRAEEAVRASGLAFTIIRPTWIYGPGDVSLNRFLGFARHFGAVPMTNFGGQQLAPVFIDDIATLTADSLVNADAIDQVFEIGGPAEYSLRDVIGQALSAAAIRRPIVPAPAFLVKLVATPLALLPTPPLTPAAVDFINQPATVDTRPLLTRMPRRLTPLDEGLRSYLPLEAGPGSLSFDGAPSRHGPVDQVSPRRADVPSGQAAR